MKLRISKAELKEAMGLGYYYWPDAPDFIEVDTDFVEPQAEGECECKCHGEYTYKSHGACCPGYEHYADSPVYIPNKVKDLEVPERLSVFMLFNTQERILRAKINEIINYIRLSRER